MEPASLLNDSVVRDLNNAINSDLATKEYRPTVSMIVEVLSGRVMLVRSPKSINAWGFPQEGVEHGEGVIEAVSRGLKEEVGLTPEMFEITKYCGTNDLELIPAHTRDGYTRGKRFYFFHVLLKPGARLSFNKREVADRKFVMPSTIAEELKMLSPEKRSSIVSAIENCYPA